MKTTNIVIALLVLSGMVGSAQTASPSAGTTQPAVALPPPTPYVITKADAHSRVWERTVYERSPSGQVVPRKHHYTELATGLNYQNASGQWVESKEEIDAYATGAIANQGSAHTRLQFDKKDPNRVYSGTEFDANGQAVKRTDFSARKNQPLPHDHSYNPETKGFEEKKPAPTVDNN
jgi:hypothetical protein